MSPQLYSTIVIALIVLSVSVSNAKHVIKKRFDWRDEGSLEWALNCDFYGNDIGSVEVPGERCGPSCESNSECTHFTWSGGKCWLKRGGTSLDQATYVDVDSVCGKMKTKTTSQKQFEWHGEQSVEWARHCDFYGNDIGNVEVPGERCSSSCESNPECTHFTWSGGNCWLKRGGISLDQATYVEVDSICGKMKRTTTGGTQLSTAQSKILQYHNEYRARHGAAPLQFSAELSEGSQSYAEHLARIGQLEHSSGPYGENLMAIGGISDNVERITVDGWYNEKDIYDFNNPGFSMATGHFTQLVWKNSKQLGIGVGMVNGRTVVVCRYQPPGNYEGQYRENVQP